MDAVTFGGAGAPTTAVVESARIKPRRSFFTRFMDALKGIATSGGSSVP